MNLSKDIYAATRCIPKSRVATYADISRAIGRPRAWRHVGNVLNHNRDPRIPCHRVVRSDGFVGGFGLPGLSAEVLTKADGTARKITKLRAEGIVVRKGKIDLSRYRIRSYQSLVISH